ncbi:hypothetical protein [Eubacterium barkeri]|uniref:Uncharacterized protein n=1 Tax=Eubacterium barkeri TaxID=1528 RepID=A0A1H3HET6_EUBBA|nr:hypothetical protein [Eubacterium barkeri]SDY13997.1 hypothetical protein SAMN04488579_11770 [Eubacterium barkeri]
MNAPTRGDLMAARTREIGRRREIVRTGSKVGIRESNAVIYALEKELERRKQGGEGACLAYQE